MQKYREEYDNISRADKYRIVEDIMASISAKGGRFMDHVEEVAKDGSTKDYWKEVSRSHAYNKVTHAFRSLRRQNLPPDQKAMRNAKKNREKSIAAAAAANGGMPPMMHPGMMGYPPPPPPGVAYPMMNPGEMGYHPPPPGVYPPPMWGAHMAPPAMDMQQAMWAQHQAFMGGAAPPPPDPKAAGAPATEAPAGKEDKSVYEV